MFWALKFTNPILQYHPQATVGSGSRKAILMNSHAREIYLHVHVPLGNGGKIGVKSAEIAAGLHKLMQQMSKWFAVCK